MTTLIFRFSSLGDVAITVPVIRCLSKKYPNHNFIVVSREKARKLKAWKKLEKVFETQEEMTGYITGKVKGGYITMVESLPCFMPASQIDLRPLKKN